MKRFTKYFLRGVFTLLPAALTAIILFSFLEWSESQARYVFSGIAGDVYFPGLGLILGIAIICGLGFLTTLPFATSILELLELPFRNTPIVKSIYLAIKNLSDYFSPEANKSGQQVVLVKYPGSEVEVIGLVTRTNFDKLPPEFNRQDRVAVYMPLSYQVGGLTVFIPRAWVRPINMRVEEAMRSALTAWIKN